MKIFRCFFIWQDSKEEAWLQKKSTEGLCLDSVKFPFTYIFSQANAIKYAYHLNAPKDGVMKLAEFEKPFLDSGWERLGRMNGWHYFRKSYSGDVAPVFDWGNAPKADRYQKTMMFLVGLLPFLLIIFPAFGKRFTPPLYDVLRILYFIFLALYTLTTLNVYRRVMQLRER